MRAAHPSARGLYWLAAMVLLTGVACAPNDPVGPTDILTADQTADPLLAAEPPMAPPRAEVFVETFDQGSNEGNWSYFGNPDNPYEVIESEGGNPGWFLHSTCGPAGCLDTYAPRLHTQLGLSSAFTGDYRARNVTELGVDLTTIGPEYVTTGGRPLSLILRQDNGTLDDYTDDVEVAFVGQVNIPMESGSFRPYRFRIPSQSPTLPEGWLIMRGTGDPDADWNKLVTSVSQVDFHYGDPFWFFMFQTWELGADNLRITTEELP